MIYFSVTYILHVYTIFCNVQVYIYITFWIIRHYICYVGTDVSEEPTDSTFLIGPFTL